MRRFSPLPLCASLVLLTAAPLAAEDAGYPVELFDGRTLNGWTIEGDCEAEVRDGVILLKSGNGWLRSDLTYADFELRLEWQALQAEKYDAGIFVRTAPGGKPWPKESFQLNLAQGHEGVVNRLRGTKAPASLRPAGEWNTFVIRAVGDRLSLAANGEPVYDVAGLSAPAGHIGLQVEVPSGGQFLVRNVGITELGHKSLFDGKSLAGWEGAGAPAEACWKVDDGLLVCTGKKGPWLRSKERYGDFNLRLEYLVEPGGNSGVFVRVPENGDHHREKDSDPPAGFEIQILDDTAPQHAKLRDYQYSGSLYDIAGATRRVGRPVGQWNTLEINCQGQHVTTTHNGTVIVDATAESHPKLALRNLAGHLGLQNHSTLVKFRRLRLGPPLARDPMK
ncbi:MAG: DUF1080 domain-containing protein [Planctomycetales bacterium]